jgi:hypothetical protein
MEFYLDIKNNDMSFEGKWMQLEDITLSELSQIQKDKGHACVLSHVWKIDPKGKHTQKQA